MRIAICEKDRESLCSLMTLIQQEAQRRHTSCMVRPYTNLHDLLWDAEEGEGFDAVFADVASGFDEIRKVVCAMRQMRSDAFVVLTADDAGGAIDGYAIGAVGYLLRPFDRASVQEVLSRLYDPLDRARLTVRHHSVVTRIPYAEIVFVESRNTKCIVHRSDGTEYVLYAQLGEIETRLSDRRFLRCHQSFLVNMDHICRADTQFEVAGGGFVAIRRRECKRIREQYLTYLEERESMNRV